MGSWQSDLEQVLEELPGKFRLEDVYQFVPYLHGRHPRNRNIEAKIRQILQDFRDEGKVRFVDNKGTYSRVVSRGSEVKADLPFRPGGHTSRAEIASIIERDPNYLRKGMAKAATGPYRNHLLLFHDEERDPYGDYIESDQVVYIGEGRSGNQKIAGNNRYLQDHFDLALKVHLFIKPSGSKGELTYYGPVICRGSERIYREEEGRSVIAFHLVPAASSSLRDYGRQYANIMSDTGPPRIDARPRRPTLIERIERDRAFSGVILRIYRKRCAVCGDPLKSKVSTELQAAHIVPVAAGGPDQISNGLSLCARHHWAFDHGVFSLSNSYTILMRAVDPHDELIQGAEIGLPEFEEEWPATFYLERHRKGNGFAA